MFLRILAQKLQDEQSKIMRIFKRKQDALLLFSVIMSEE